MGLNGACFEKASPTLKGIFLSNQNNLQGKHLDVSTCTAMANVWLKSIKILKAIELGGGRGSKISQ